MTFLIPGVYLTVELILAGMLYIGASEIKPALLKTWVGLTLLMGTHICPSSYIRFHILLKLLKCIFNFYA